MIWNTVMREAFENAKVTPETDHQLLRSVAQCFERGAGAIPRKQMWNRKNDPTSFKINPEWNKKPPRRERKKVNRSQMYEYSRC